MSVTFLLIKYLDFHGAVLICLSGNRSTYDKQSLQSDLWTLHSIGENIPTKTKIKPSGDFIKHMSHFLFRENLTVTIGRGAYTR